jgi:hypothetical protein
VSKAPKQIDVRGHCASILVEQNRLERVTKVAQQRAAALTALLTKCRGQVDPTLQKQIDAAVKATPVDDADLSPQE